MALSKVTYVDGVTIIGAKNLNDIQDELIRQGEQQTADEESMEAALALKADKSDTYTKAQVDTALNGKADKSDTYTKAQVDASLALKADKANTYTKTEVDASLELKADKTETYTKAQVDSIVEDAIAEAVKESEYSNFEMKSVSGDFIHITDGAGLIPVKDLKIGIEAVQDLHGYNAPWVGGAGKNKAVLFTDTGEHRGVIFSVDEFGVINLNGTGSSSGNVGSPSFVLPAGDYYLSDNVIGTFPSNSSARTQLMDINDTLLAGINNSSPADTVVEFTLTEETEVYYRVRVNNGSTYSNAKIRPMVCLQSAGSDYAPYSNICPISGWTGAEVKVAGKNLYSNVFSDYVKPYDYYICPIKMEKGKSYKLSVTKKSTITGCVIGFAKKGKKYTEFGSIDTIVNTDGNISSYMPETLVVNDSYESPKLIVFCSGEEQFNQLFEAYDVQLERGNEVTEFEPYKGTTYSVTWETEAGTVYGGVLDVTTGELVVTHGFVGKKWSDGFSEFAPAGNLYKRRTFQLPFSAKSGAGNSFTNCVAQYNAGMPSTVPYFYIDGYLYLWLPVGTDENFDIELCAVLNTPQTYQLTPTEVLTLLGENNIFADTGAVEELIYRISRQ